MGYHSTVVIGIHHSVIALDLISTLIPECLKECDFVDVGTARYWKLYEWKWYSSYPEIQAIEALFKELDELDPVTISDAGEDSTVHPFGAVRVGEEFGDTQTWGDPDDYEIYINQSISSPIPT